MGPEIAVRQRQRATLAWLAESAERCPPISPWNVQVVEVPRYYGNCHLFKHTIPALHTGAEGKPEAGADGGPREVSAPRCRYTPVARHKPPCGDCLRCCSQCNFTSQFESALRMHRQLHHDDCKIDEYPELSRPMQLMPDKSCTMPVLASLRAAQSPHFGRKINRAFSKLPSRTASATRLFDKLRARISKSRILFSHTEEAAEGPRMNNLSLPSECTSKLKMDTISRVSPITTYIEEQRETYGCHLCSFNADRITALDRHLLNEHNLSLDSILKLVMAKTKDGLNEESTQGHLYGIRQPYYKPPNEVVEDEEFVIETVAPKIKILKHAATITDLLGTDIAEPRECSRSHLLNKISQDLEDLMMEPIGNCDNFEFLAKMQTLNDCMCRFVDSSNTLKKVLTQRFDTKRSAQRLNGNDTYLDLSLNEDNTPREWGRSRSEKMVRSRTKYGDNIRDEKLKMSSESFYF